MAAVAGPPRSPAVSPRLPSPPPFPEVQLPPKSPGMSATNPPDPSPPAHSLRRIRPGTKAADMMAGPPLIPLSELDSPFQLQEHLKSLHSHHTHSSGSDTTTPITPKTALEIATPPSGIDRALWLYELTRFLVLKANDLIVHFFRESPPCSASTCPEMRASEWQYLCAVHEPPKPCCAIDYSCHTLDWAAFVLTSQKHFPSRLTLNEGAGGQGGGVRHLTNIMRRVYRIFAHAWFSHRQTFWDVEGSQGLYILFKCVCDVYGLIPEENYTIPKEAEGEAVEDEAGREERRAKGSPQKKAVGGREDDQVTPSAASTATAQRRHKATPSVGSSVATIQEGDEDEGKSPGHGAMGPVGGLADRMAKSVLGDTPLPTSSKAAEKVESPRLRKDDIPTDVKVEERPVGESEGGGSPEKKAKVEEVDPPPAGDLPRSNSSDSVATMVKVEEKGSEDE